MKKEINNLHLLATEVSKTIEILTKHPETGENCGQDYGDSKDMVETFIQSGFASQLLEMFWQRKSDGCPLETTEAGEQLNQFEEWLKCISFENVDTYLNVKSVNN
jgi:hypothetical protein